MQAFTEPGFPSYHQIFPLTWVIFAIGIQSWIQRPHNPPGWFIVFNLVLTRLIERVLILGNADLEFSRTELMGIGTVFFIHNLSVDLTELVPSDF